MIREANIKDIPQISKISKEFFEEYISKYNLGFNEKDFQKSCEFFINNPLTIILVYEIDHKIVSSLAGVVSPWLSDFSKILVSEQWWYTYKEYRSKIKSYLLVEELIKWGKTLNATHVILISLYSKDLERIKKFYQRKNFKETEVHFIKEI